MGDVMQTTKTNGEPVTQNDLDRGAAQLAEVVKFVFTVCVRGDRGSMTIPTEWVDDIERALELIFE